MPYRYRRYSRRRRGLEAAAQHMEERRELTKQFGGIDREVEKIFMSLPPQALEWVLSEYGLRYGEKAEVYARKTYSKWKSGNVKMGGQTAARILDLLPPVLPASVRFDLIKQLRLRHFERKKVHVNSSPEKWREDLIKPIQELVESSAAFSLPKAVLEKAQWLSDGDSDCAQKLLAAAEQEEAASRLAYIEEELGRIEMFMQDIDTTRRMTHTLKIPQGDVTLHVELPARTLWQKLLGWLR